MGAADLDFSVQPEYLVVRRPSNYKVSDSNQAVDLEKISAACKNADRQRVLILGPDTEVALSVLDILDLGKEIVKLGLKIAIVEQHDASSTDEEFLETVALNRGGSLKFCDNEQDAKKWLGVT